MRTWILTAVTILTAVDGCLMTGCSSGQPKTPEQHQQAMEAMNQWANLAEQSRSKASVSLRWGGSPIQAWMKNENAVGLGSNDATLEVDFEFDFTQPPRVKPPVDPTLHASLPMDQAELVAFLQSLPPHPAILAAIDQLDQKMAMRLGETRADAGQ